MLVSSDQYSFILPKKAALKAGMLSDMLGEDSKWIIPEFNQLIHYKVHLVKV